MVLKSVIEKKRNSFILESIILILFGVVLLFKNEPYFFILSLYAFISNYDEKIYLLSNAFIVSFTYIFLYEKGNVIFLISALFFFFKILSSFIFKKQNVKRYFAYIFTSLITFIIFFIKDISFNNFTNLFLAFSLSFIYFYAFHKILDSYQYSSNMIDSKDRIIIFSIIQIVFSHVSVFSLIFIRIVHIFLIKCSKFSEALSSLILVSFILAYFYKIDPYYLITLIFPFLFSSMVFKKYPLISYLLFYILTCVFIINDFYKDRFFYEGLIAILFTLLIKENIFYKIKNILKPSENIVLEKQNENIENVLRYLSIVLDSKLENIKDPLEVTYEELKKNLCLTCENKDKCFLSSIIKFGIKNNYQKEQRKEILDKCIYPYKLFKRTITFHEIYLNEEKKLKENLQVQNLYKKELENLYYPLKIDKNENKEESIIKELEKENIVVIDIKNFKETTLIEIEKYKFDDEETIISVLEKIYQTSFIFINKKYSFSLGSYILEFSKKAKYKASISTFTKSYSLNINGDNLFYENNNNTFKLLLSDGMGHNKKAAALSEYLIESINAYSKIDSSLSRQIETVNRLIYQKTTIEMYATLDYFILDLVTLKFTLFKAGSFPTYIYHNNKLKESKKNFTPLGILEKIEPFAFRDFLNEGDIIVFLSDGFGYEVKEIIEKVVTQNKEKSPKEIMIALKEALLNETSEEDDKTLIVIKIEKI